MSCLKSLCDELLTDMKLQPGDSKDRGYVGSIDNGTTSSRFLIFDAAGNPVAQHQIEFEQFYPNSGFTFYNIRLWAPADRSRLAGTSMTLLS